MHRRPPPPPAAAAGWAEAMRQYGADGAWDWGAGDGGLAAVAELVSGVGEVDELLHGQGDVAAAQDKLVSLRSLCASIRVGPPP